MSAWCFDEEGRSGYWKRLEKMGSQPSLSEVASTSTPMRRARVPRKICRRVCAWIERVSISGSAACKIFRHYRQVYREARRLASSKVCKK